jgi:thermitase
MRPTSIRQVAKSLCPSLPLMAALGLVVMVPLLGHAAPARILDRNVLSVPMIQATPEVQPGEILVKFEADVSSLAIETINQDLRVSVIEMIPELGLYRLRIPEETTITEMIGLYRRTAGVAYAEPNYIVHALETTPDDPRFGDQWALSKIGAPAAWDIVTGTNDIVIAIIDTGIDYHHPDLDDGRYVGGYDFINEDDDPMDDEGHGTHVTGIATADTNNGEGIAGVAWNSRFMAVKVLDAGGSGTDYDVADGLVYAATEGAHVANLSLGGALGSFTLENAMQYAYDAGVVMACAAGNDYGYGVSYPAAYDSYCLGVAATTVSDQRAAFSNYGPEVDVGAPGVDIWSTTGGSYESWGGTSMATPHVAGLAALILAQDPDLSVDQVFAAIRGSADDVNAETLPGEDDYLGTGRINAFRALTARVKLEPPDIRASLGFTFTVDVVIEGIVDLGSFQFDVTYDPSVVTVDDVRLGPFLGSTGRSVTEIGPHIDNGAGATGYGATSSGTDPGPDGTGVLAVLATITFHATGLGSSSLHFGENMTVAHTSGSVIPIVAQDGSVAVADAFVRIEPPGTTVRIGSSFTVTAVIEDVTDLGSFQFDLAYDSGVVTATGAACGLFLGSTGRSVSPVGPTIDNTGGRITFGCSSEGGEPGPDGTGVLAVLGFNAAGLGHSSLQFESVQMKNTTGVTISVGTNDGEVTVTPGCPEDVNGDGVVNIVDIQSVAARWGAAEGDENYDPACDINGDGRINIIDIQLVAGKWGTTC